MPFASFGCMLRIVLCEEAPEAARAVERALAGLGHAIIDRIRDATMLKAATRRLAPDVIIVVTHSPSAALIEALGFITHHAPLPMVLFAGDPDRASIVAAVRAGASAYVTGAIAPERIAPVLDDAIARFEQLQSLRNETAAAKAELNARKLIERAKGILMKSRKLSEEDAYRAMRKQAMDRKLKLTEVARQIIAVADLLG